MDTKRPAIVVERDSARERLMFDVDGIGVLALSVYDLAPDIKDRALWHGLEQKVRDAAAIGYKQTDGSFRRPTNREKYEAMRKVIATLDSGEWNLRREGVSDTGLLFEALCRMYPEKAADSIKAKLEGFDEKQKAGLRRNPKVAEMIEKIRAERNPDAATVAESLLDAFSAD